MSNQLLSKQAHFQHEIKSKENLNKKLQETILKLQEKPTAGTAPSSLLGKIEQKEVVPILNADFVAISRSEHFEYQVMMNKSMENIKTCIDEENRQLKECLKHLQDELF